MSVISPYFDSTPEYYAKLTEGMSERAKYSFANALAHGMIPIVKNSHGWWLTRNDYICDKAAYCKSLTSLVDNEGTWHFNKDYKSDKEVL